MVSAFRGHLAEVECRYSLACTVAMKEAGCRLLIVGFESGAQEGIDDPPGTSTLLATAANSARSSTVAPFSVSPGEAKEFTHNTIMLPGNLAKITLQILPELPSLLLHLSITLLRKNHPSAQRFLSLPNKCVRLEQRVLRRSRSTRPAA